MKAEKKQAHEICGYKLQMSHINPKYVVKVDMCEDDDACVHYFANLINNEYFEITEEQYEWFKSEFFAPTDSPIIPLND